MEAQELSEKKKEKIAVCSGYMCSNKDSCVRYGLHAEAKRSKTNLSTLTYIDAVVCVSFRFVNLLERRYE